MPRVNLPVIQDRPSPRVSCLQCARCCTYVAVGINAPTTPKRATEILWQLYHEGVSVCRDEKEWYVQFEARCLNLGEGNLCSVYANRPHICRAFDSETCEVNAPEGGLITFREPQQFLEYLSRKRPKVYRAIQKTYVPSSYAPGAVGRDPGPQTRAGVR